MARIAAGGRLVEHVEGKAVQRVAATPNGETVQELRTIDASQLTIEQRDALRAAILAEKERRG
jgi:phosphoribosylformylglycinamidine (FGAM) synthase PurS component